MKCKISYKGKTQSYSNLYIGIDKDDCMSQFLEDCIDRKLYSIHGNIQLTEIPEPEDCSHPNMLIHDDGPRMGWKSILSVWILILAVSGFSVYGIYKLIQWIMK